MARTGVGLVTPVFSVDRTTFSAFLTECDMGADVALIVNIFIGNDDWHLGIAILICVLGAVCLNIDEWNIVHVITSCIANPLYCMKVRKSHIRMYPCFGKSVIIRKKNYMERMAKMMLQELYERQSIRKYQAKPVEEEKIEQLLRAAMQAPSARNTQSWRFLVVTNRAALDSMVELQPYTGMMKSAPCAIIVLGDRTAEENDAYLYVNAAAAIENMLIEAVNQGLGTCWCAIAPNAERIAAFRQYYSIAQDELPIGVVAVGYGDEVKTKQDRFDPAKIRYFK